MAVKKQLYRSDDNKIIAGVLGGIGEYTGIDPTVLRLIFLVVLIFTGFIPGVIFYILAALIMPKKPS